MQITLNNKYRIKTDSLNYTLEELKVHTAESTKKEENIGQEYATILGYYSRIEHMANAIMELEIKKSDVEILEDIKSLMKDSVNSLTDSVNIAIDEFKKGKR